MIFANQKLFTNIHQGLLESQLQVLFPNHSSYVNARSEVQLKYPTTDSFVEFDFWIPSLNLGFEYQDVHHYVTTWYYQKSHDRIFFKDNTKKNLSQQSGISLIVIPCWWNGSLENLAATIRFQRPDLLEDFYVSPISINPPPKYFPSHLIPDVGELMLASFPMDINFKKTLDETKWWMGEKYDGIRCCWNPVRKEAYSRVGIILQMLDAMKDKLPQFFLDCEFWFGRGSFGSTHMLISGSTHLVPWHSLKLVTFDTPDTQLQNELFEDRYSLLLSKIPLNHSFLNVAARIESKGRENILKKVQGIIDDGGEGVILRKHSSLYERGRTQNLVKLKATQNDREGMVIAVNDDLSVCVKLPEGTTFIVPPERVTIEGSENNTIQLTTGDIVSFSFDQHARREVPVQPTIFRIRHDLFWDDVVRASVQERKFLNESSGYKKRPVGHWNVKNMRMFLEVFARSKGLDPLSADTWYNFSGADIKQIRGGESVMSKFKGGYLHTIQILFPEISLDVSTYRNRQTVASGDKVAQKLEGEEAQSYSHYWQDVRNRRKYFDDYAFENSFDPLIPDNWYSQTLSKIMAQKGGRRVILYHGGSVSQALMDLYPDIGIIKAKLPFHPRWSEEKNRRKFFEEYAKQKGIDFCNPCHWYSQSRDSITAFKGANSVLSYYSGSVAKALISLFPNIGLEQNKFWDSWNVAENRKKFFEEYAKENNFDPNVATNWYKRSRESILSKKGGYSVISFHKLSVKKALIDLFPHVQFSRSLFWQSPSWDNINTRREFFEDYAKNNKFDPLVAENWYAQSRDSITSCKGAANVMSYHSNSIPQALIDLFPTIGLQKHKFLASAVWPDKNKRKLFFDSYALDNGFDPLSCENWYSQNLQRIKDRRGSFMVLSYYNGRASAALMDVYPHIGLCKNTLVSSWRKNAGRT